MVFKVSKHFDYYYIVNNADYLYLWKDGTLNKLTYPNQINGEEKYNYGCWKTRQEAETFLRNYKMSKERLKQVEKDIKLLEEEKDKIVESLKERIFLHGQWFKSRYGGERIMLCRVGAGQYILINENGNRWSSFLEPGTYEMPMSFINKLCSGLTPVNVEIKEV